LDVLIVKYVITVTGFILL